MPPITSKRLVMDFLGKLLCWIGVHQSWHNEAGGPVYDGDCHRCRKRLPRWQRWLEEWL